MNALPQPDRDATQPRDPVPDPALYWFPAKRYGYGWGFPVRWQGWAVFAAYLLSLVALSLFWVPGRSTVGFGIGVGVTTAIVIAICFWKGEPARWRWGGR